MGIPLDRLHRTARRRSCRHVGRLTRRQLWQRDGRKHHRLYKTECIRAEEPWRTVEDVELATLSWVHWWNTARILAPNGDIPPIEFEHAWRTTHTTDERAKIAPNTTQPDHNNGLATQ